MNYNKFETQRYRKSGNGLSSENMRWIYALRCRTLPLKCNAPSQHTDNLCLAPGCLGEDRNEHVYSCQYLSEGNQITENNHKFDDIFSKDVKKQLLVLNIFRKQYEKRREFISSNVRGYPEAPQDSMFSGSREIRSTKRKRNKNKLR